MSMHRHGRDEILGLTFSDHDLVVFLEAAGTTDSEPILDDPVRVGWRGADAHRWNAA
ncbi:hypothetical protein ACFWIA_19850 [Streptomyces sp. NPDC127068]|uniref:hypothetical protein n=1 Tax=Streptomyces sp. NPDC127068 TaxID=3347127 RepID=UPI00364FE097